MNKILIILLLSPLFCIAQIPKEPVIDSARQARQDSVYAARQAIKAYADSLKLDSINYVRFQKDSLHNLKQDSIIAAHKSKADTGSNFPQIPVVPTDSRLLIIDIEYTVNSAHVVCDNCFVTVISNGIEIHYEKPKE